MIRGLFTLACLLTSINVYAKEIHVESLKGRVTDETVLYLRGLACRNVDKVVRLQIHVEVENATAEDKDYKRLVFWKDDYEYLLPEGSYVWLHGGWQIDGYFIVKSGGVHQGTLSAYFKRIDDALVLLNPDVSEKEVKSSTCPTTSR